MPIAECTDYKDTKTMRSFTAAMFPMNYLSLSKMKVNHFNLFLWTRTLSLVEGALNGFKYRGGTTKK